MTGYIATKEYHVLSAPSDEKGTGGIQLWVSKTFRTHQAEIPITTNHMDILHADHKRLLVKIQAGCLRWLLVVGHAPTTDQAEESHRWWGATEHAIPGAVKHWPRIVMVDGNARLGSEPSPHVGTHQADQENAAGEGMHQWMMDNGLWAPSTFQGYHQGGAGTWKHARGPEARLDYILIPMAWHAKEGASWIPDDIDLTIKKVDHFPVALEIEVDITTIEESKPPRARPDLMLLRSTMKEVMLNGFKADYLLRSAWNMTVHDHAIHIAKNVRSMQQNFAKGAVRRKTHLQEDTWRMVRYKKATWQEHRQHGKQHRYNLLVIVY